MQKLIHKDMIIGEVIEKFPEKALEISEVMSEFGIHCIGCMASGFETLKEGVLGHGFSEEELNLLIEKLNEIANENKKSNLTVSNFSFNLTKSAVKKIDELIKTNNSDENILRVSVLAGGCSGFVYNLELVKKESENDFTFTKNELKIAVDSESMEFLNNAEIDYMDSLNESGFKFNNPNSHKNCHCGKSFR